MNAILLQLMNERYVVVSLSSIVYIVPQGKGSAIKTTHGDLGVLESPEAIYELWHGSCTNSTNSTNSTNIVEPKNTTPITTNTNSSNSKNMGILVCGSGMGMAMAANKHKKIRAAVCYSVKNTKLSRLHNNANIITLGSRLTKKNIAFKCIEVFVNTKFEGGRHKKRVKKI